MDYPLVPDVVVYHGNCNDGFTAAYVCHKKFGDFPEYIEGFYDREINLAQFVGKDVLIVDFSYKAPVLHQIAAVAQSITILDHHESAYRELEGFADFAVGGDGFESWEDARKRAREHGDAPNVMVSFDMKRSGAMMAWNFLFPGQSTPMIVIFAQDYDLWRFELTSTKSIISYLGAFEKTFENWSALEAILEDPEKRVGAITAGIAIETKQTKDIRLILEQATTIGSIAGHTVPIANVPFMFASEAGNVLASRYTEMPFAATYWVDHMGSANVSLRSRKPDGANVSKIAEIYGGGGHHHAAGFRMTRTINAGEDVWMVIP